MTDTRSLAGRTMLLGLPATSLDPDLRRALRDLEPAGVILFGRNLDSPAKLASLMRELEGALPETYLVALDQEGGRVSRLEPWVGPTPTAARLAELGDETTERFARATGDSLRALGFNLDFAPVVDLCLPGVSNGIGDRSFGESEIAATRLAGSFLTGLKASGVAGCLKHFPGLGDTAVDSHEELPTCPRSVAELEARDLLPYRELCDKAPAVMVGHAHYPAWVSGDPEPATGCAGIVDGILRDRLEYGGLVATDDLEMGAVVKRDIDGSFAVRSMAAGCDLLLYCHDLDRARRARDAMAARADQDTWFLERLRHAVTAIDALALAYPAPRPDLEAFAAARDELGAFGSAADRS